MESPEPKAARARASAHTRGLALRCRSRAVDCFASRPTPGHRARDRRRWPARPADRPFETGAVRALWAWQEARTWEMATSGGWSGIRLARTCDHGDDGSDFGVAPRFRERSPKTISK